VSGLTVKITGAKEVERALEQFTPATGRAVLRRALKKAAKPIQQTAKQYAPYDQGDLERSIKIKVAPGKKVGGAEYSKVLRDGGTKDEAVAAMRTVRRNSKKTAPIAEVRVVAIGALVEFGTDERFLKNGKSVGAMPPDPFMRPAFDAKAAVAAAIIRREITEEIERTASRLAAKAARTR